MRNIGNPPQPVENWLAQLALEDEQAALRTGWWQITKRRRLQAQAWAFWLARAYVLDALGHPAANDAMLEAINRGMREGL